MTGTIVLPRRRRDILTLDDIKAKGGVIAGRKIVGKDTLMASYTNDSSYSVCQVDVSKHKRVRFPSVPRNGTHRGCVLRFLRQGS